MLVNVYLEGYLAKFVKDGTVVVDAFNARDALEKLQNYLPKGVRHLVKIKELGCVDDLDEVKETLTIVPLFEGSGGGKRSAGIQIGIGILLIAFLWWGGAFAAGAKLTAFQTFTLNTAASLIIGGALQLLQKSPKADPTQGDKRSRFINGDKNTIKEGTPIPLIYGRQKVYPHILSFNIDSSDYNPATE